MSQSEYREFGATESFGECVADELQHLATELQDHGDRLTNVEKQKIETHLNIMRNVNRDWTERQTIRNHKP